jgi:hypothetical protein
MVVSFEDEGVEGSGRNEFRPYIFGGNLGCQSYADGKKSVSLADATVMVVSFEGGGLLLVVDEVA